MKRVMVFFFLFGCSEVLCPSSLYLSADLLSMDFLFRDSVCVSAEFGYEESSYRASISLLYGRNPDEDFSYLKGNISAAVFPIDDLGLVIGLSVFDGGVFWGWGSAGLSYLISSETYAGWEIRLGSVVIEPRIIFTEALSRESDEDKALKKNIPQLTSVRASLLIGISH